MSTDFVPIRLKTLEPEIPLGFTVYIKLPSRYIKYIQSGDEFDTARYKRLKKQKVRKLYIVSSDEENYQKFLNAKLDAAINDDNMASDERANLVTSIASDALENLASGDTSAAAIEQIENTGRNMTDIINKDPNVLKELFSAEKDDDITVSSAINTSSLAVRVAKLLAFDKGLLQSIGTGSLLRDISIPKMDKRALELYTLPYEDFSEDDWKLYKTHPTKSVEMLGSMSGINAQIKDIVGNHEEKKNGNGFPKGAPQLTMQSEIVALCSLFDRYVTCLNYSAADSLEKIKNEEKTSYDKKYVKMLEDVLLSIDMI